MRSLDDIFEVYKNNAETENACRREILKGTIEDHWQEKFGHQTIEEMGVEMFVSDDGVAVPYNRYYKTDKQRETAQRESFFHHFGVKRARFAGLPSVSVIKTQISGKTCIQYDNYDRLPSLGIRTAQTKPTAGGIEHDRAYHCYWGGEVVKIGAYVVMAPGYHVDVDAFMKPVLDSIRWFSD